jgi:hypothetical protein
MLDLSKAPRWALISVNAVTMGGLLFFGNRAIAEGDKTKTVAYEGRSTANKALEDVTELKQDFKDFRFEYKQDQKELDRKLGELLRKV